MTEQDKLRIEFVSVPAGSAILARNLHPKESEKDERKTAVPLINSSEGVRLYAPRHNYALELFLY